MKRSLLLTIAIVLLTACKGDPGPVGPPGLNGKDGKDGEGMGWYTTSIYVHESEWKLKGNPGDLNSYFYVFKSLSALDSYVYESGTVIAYIEPQPGVKNGMPYVLHLGEEYNEKEFLWTQTYDFDFEKGGVGFYVTYSDFNTYIRPGSETFHVVLMW